MDKQTFLNLAPEYYMLALYIHTQYPEQYYTDVGWKTEFTVPDQEALEDYCYVGNDALRAEAIRLMVEQGAINVLADYFGPTIWQKTDRMESLVNALENSAGNVFFKAKASGDPRRWLYAALEKLNVEASKHGITEADFVHTTIGNVALDATVEVVDSASIDEWSPIPIEQADAAVQHAIVTIDETIKQVEQSNGYASEHAEERRYVLDGLKALSNTLKTASSVSVRYIKDNGFQMLKLIRDRFTNTAIDQSAKAASDALWHLVKKAGEWVITYFSGGGS